MAARAFETSAPNDLPEIVIEYAEELRGNPDLACIALDKCASYHIPRLYRNLPEEVQRDRRICKFAIGKLDNEHIAGFFEHLPQELRNDVELSLLAMERIPPSQCDDYHSLGARDNGACLFMVFTEEVRSRRELVNLVLERCWPVNVIQVFRTLPPAFQSDRETCILACEKCRNDTVANLFKFFPEGLRGSAEFAMDVLNAMQNGSVNYAALVKLFPLFTEEVQNNADVCKRLIVKCTEGISDGTSPGVPDVFKLFPEKLRKNTDIVKLAVETCRDVAIPELFNEFPQELSSNLEIAFLVVKKCKSSVVPKLFVSFSTDLRKNSDLLLSTLNNMESIDDSYEKHRLTYDLPEFFSALSEEIQSDSKIQMLCINFACEEKMPGDILQKPTVAVEKCNARCIPWLFSWFSEELRNDVEVVQCCINKCDQCHVSQLFCMFTEEICSRREIVNAALGKVYGEDSIVIFKKLPQEFRRDQEIYMSILEQMSADVADFFESLPQDLQRDPQVAIKVLQKCPGGYDYRAKIWPFLELFTKLSPELQSNPVFVKSALGVCSTSMVPKLFEKLPQNLQSTTEIVLSALERYASDFQFLEFFLSLPKEMRDNVDVALCGITNCSSYHMMEVFVTFPEEVRNAPEMQEFIKIAIKEKKMRSEDAIEVFFMLPDEFRSNIDIMGLVFERAGTDLAWDVFGKLPEELRNTETQKVAFAKTGSPLLFDNLPEDLRKNAELVSQAINVCSGYNQGHRYGANLPNLVLLFSKLPQELRGNHDLAILALNKCDSGVTYDERNYLVELFHYCSDDLKRNVEFVARAIERVSEEVQLPNNGRFDQARFALKYEGVHLHLLFAQMPTDLRNNRELASLALNNCCEKGGCELFAMLSEELRGDQEIALLAFEKVGPKFCKHLPHDLLQNIVFASLVLSKCQSRNIPEVFGHFAEDLRCNHDFAMVAIRRDEQSQYCHDNGKIIPELFALFSEDLRRNWDLVVLAVKICHKQKLQELLTELPEDLRSDLQENAKLLGMGVQDYAEAQLNSRVVQISSAEGAADGYPGDALVVKVTTPAGEELATMDLRPQMTVQELRERICEECSIAYGSLAIILPSGDRLRAIQAETLVSTLFLG